MIVSSTDFKAKVGEYLERAAHEEVLITRYGKIVATLSSPNLDRNNNSDLGWDSLLGLARVLATESPDQLRTERLARQ